MGFASSRANPAGPHHTLPIRPYRAPCGFVHPFRGDQTGRLEEHGGGKETEQAFASVW